MRRRIRIDLGQEAAKGTKEERVLDRKRQRWADRNRDRLHENPFIKAIRPDQEHYGDPDERGDELRARLEKFEFGNYPGYFNYRNKAAAENKIDDDDVDSRAGDSRPREQCPQADITICDSSQQQPGAKKSAAAPAEANSAGRPLEAGLSDERLTFMKEEWFLGKNVLDIGCNRGHMTYAIARLFSPKSIVGIDIDLKMIKMANRDLHLHLEEGLLKQARELRRERAAKLRLEGGSTSCPLDDPNQLPLSSYISRGPLVVPTNHDDDDTTPQRNEDSSSKAVAALADDDDDQQRHVEQPAVACPRFPNNIVFVEHNYVLSKDELLEKQRAHFDVIVCLSVTKWIHLNYCDDGLKRFFKRIYRHLKEGGLLILEAQPYENYNRKRKLSDRLRANYYSIQFKPEDFDAYLLGEQVGFRRIIFETMTEHECVGFKRPLKVFLK